MGLINHNWLNAQMSRRYPLDDNATGTGDDGTRINDDVIVDLHLRWPSVAGGYAFIGGITVTKTIITVVILAADSPQAAANFTPLAAVTVRQPATEYSYYNLEPLYPGVGGFIAFGDTDERFTIRFSTPAQGLLAPKVGRPYTELPIPSMRKFGRHDGLTGLITISAGPDLEIVKSQVNVDGNDVDALVIRLQLPTSTRNPLADYIGPCGKRPESQNCDRTGIQTINGVSPDCDGNLEIEFLGITAANYADCGSDGAGVTLEENLGIDDVCPLKTPNRFAGSDYCHPVSESSVSVPSEGSAGSDSGSEPEPEPSGSESCAGLPFLDGFDEPQDNWTLKLGKYRIVNTDSPEEPTG